MEDLIAEQGKAPTMIMVKIGSREREEQLQLPVQAINLDFQGISFIMDST